MIQKSGKKKIIIFRTILILGMVLSSCSFDMEKSVLSDNMSSGKKQKISFGEKVVMLMEVLEIQGETELVRENFGLKDGEQNQLEKVSNIPPKGVKVSNDYGLFNNEIEERGRQLREKGEEAQGQQREEQIQIWQNGYLEVIYHLQDYLAPRYDPLTHIEIRDDASMNISIFYFGLHDFDEDGILELITGNARRLAVFTYKDGSVEKIADLCPPDLSATWCVDGVHFKDNAIRVECDGSGGANVVNFGYFGGEYVLGYYNEQNPCEPIMINGSEGTIEEMEGIYTLDYDKMEKEELRERFQLVNEGGVWILKSCWWSHEESILDMDFDFESVIW